MSVIVKNGFQYYSSSNNQFKEVTLEEYNDLERKGLVDSRTVYCVFDYNDVIRANKIVYNDEITNFNVNNIQDAINVMGLKNDDYLNLFKFQTVYRDNISVDKSTSVTYEFNVAKEGYTPIGVVRWASSNASTNGTTSFLINFLNFWTNAPASIVGVAVKNNSSSTTAKIRIDLEVMYIKNEYYDKYKAVYIAK